MGQAQFMYGNDPGMPALGTLGAGDLVRVLDAALVNGGTTQSVTGITRVSTTATANKTAHGLRNKQMVVISGAVQTDYNGTFRITRIDANNFSFTVAGSPVTPATGTLLVKIAPLGNWGIAFTASNQRVYRAASGLRHYLMVNDNSNTNTSIVRAFTAMTAITTGTGPFPTATQSDTNLRWLRPDPTSFADTGPPSGTPGTYNDSWCIVGDDKRFYIGICNQGSGYRFWHGFGEPWSYKASDLYHTFMAGAANSVGDDTLNPMQWPYLATPQQPSQGADVYYAPTNIVLARAYGQVTASWIVGLLGGFGPNETYQASTIGTAPTAGTSSPISAGIELAPIDILEYTGGPYHRRGRLPGMLQTWNPPDFVNNDGTVYPNVTNFGDVLIVRGSFYNQTAGIAFHLGDWDTPPT